MAREEVDAAARFKLIDGLARGLGADAAAKAAGYTRMWGYRLRQDPTFMAEVEKRRTVLAAGVVEEDGGAKGDVAYAVRRLRELAEKPDEPGAYVAVNACKAILDLARKPLLRPKAESPPPVKLLPGITDDGKAADEWLKAQETG